jgi:hypothetical protein
MWDDVGMDFSRLLAVGLLIAAVVLPVLGVIAAWKALVIGGCIVLLETGLRKAWHASR